METASQSTMSLPCSHCGAWNRVAGGERTISFACVQCGGANTLQRLQAAPSAPVAPSAARYSTAGRTAHAGRQTYARPTAVAAPRTGNLKKVLVSLLAVAAIAVIVKPSGTFATFNATTTNSSSITTGTLVLSNKVNAGAACLSYSTANISAANSNGCSVLWNLSGVTPSSGAATATADITIFNSGNLTPSSFKLFANGSCTDSAAADTNGNSGAGLLCSQVQFVIYQTTTNSFATLSSCVYGNVGVGTTPITGCAWDSSHTLADVGTNHQTGNSPFTLTNLSGNTQQFYVLAVLLPSTTDNTFQGRQAQLQVNWQTVQ
jgi:hypothetical protein